MKEIDPKVQRIITWREQMATLPDNQFFELMRVYLGEVHTPFNKTKLVEELGAFLRKDEHQKAIVSLLSESDLQLLCAVWHIPNATQEKIAAFFSESASFAPLYEQLLNLEERLLIYRCTDKKTGKTIICINPMLEAVLLPLLTPSVLLPEPVLQEMNNQSATALTPELLASYACFLLAEPDVCKNDGTFKKRIATQLETLFPGLLPLLQQLTVAFINLQILKEAENKITLDRQRLEKFAALDEINQYTLLTVASHGRFSRSGMSEQMQLLLNTASRIGKNGCSRSSLLRMAFLIAEKNSDVPGLAPFGRTSRFSSLLAASSFADETPLSDSTASALLDRLLDTAVSFGILALRGTDCNGENVYIRGALLENASAKTGSAPGASLRGAKKSQSAASARRILTIDAGFSVTLLPGAPLSVLLPLINCMDLRQFDTAASFEITKKAVMRAFDAGFSEEQIVEMLSANALYELPQNLTVCLDDWYTAFSSAAVFKGYILQISAENIARVEKNRRLAPDIVRCLAPGIYLLKAENDLDAEVLMRRSGLDFFGSIKGVEKPKDLLSFPEARYTGADARETPEDDSGSADDRPTAAVDAHLAAMRDALESLAVLPEQKEGLLERIERKVIVDPVQLRGDSVRLERLEAGGMDYAGKLHIIDSAITANCLVELAYENPADAAGEPVVFVGIPLGVEKFEGDALLRIEVVPQHEEKKLSVGQARLVKRIRGSAFK